MELKCDQQCDQTFQLSTFNRTAYGIEMRVVGDWFGCGLPFNRTAYGIEIF